MPEPFGSRSIIALSVVVCSGVVCPLVLTDLFCCLLNAYSALSGIRGGLPLTFLLPEPLVPEPFGSRSIIAYSGVVCPLVLTDLFLLPFECLIRLERD